MVELRAELDLEAQAGVWRVACGCVASVIRQGQPSWRGVRWRARATVSSDRGDRVLLYCEYMHNMHMYMCM